MPFALICPGCATRLTLNDDRAGSTLPCPKCSTQIRVQSEPIANGSRPEIRPPDVPDASTSVTTKLHFRCPACRKRYKANGADAGKRMACKLCGTVVLIPEASDPNRSQETSVNPTGDDKPEEDVLDGESADEEPVPDHRSTADPEPPDDYVLPRRRKRGFHRLGLLIVGGLGVTVLIALGGIALKVNRARETTTKREAQKTEEREKSPPYHAPKREAQKTEEREKSPPHVAPRTDASPRADTNEKSLSEAGVVIFGYAILLPIGAIIWWLASSWVDVCPHCGKWKAVRYIGRRVLERKKCYGLVVRHSRSTSRGLIFTSKGAASTMSSSGSEWEERVPVIRTYYEHKFRCRFCRKKWAEEYVKEVEDFEPDEPLPSAP